jgi:hypothetical protein
MDNNNNISISKMTIVNFYKNKLMDIFTSFFVKFFIQIKNDTNISTNLSQTLENIQKDIDNDKIYEKFSSYLNRKYDLNLHDIDLALHIFYKEYLQQLLHSKLSVKKQKDILYAFFIKCCKKNAKELYNIIHSGNTLSSTIILKTVHTNTNNLLDDIIPIEIMNYNYINNMNDDDNDNGKHNKKNINHHQQLKEQDDEREDEYEEENEQDNIKQDNIEEQNKIEQHDIIDNTIDNTIDNQNNKQDVAITSSSTVDQHKIHRDRCVDTETIQNLESNIKNTLMEETMKKIADVNKNERNIDKSIKLSKSNSTTTLDTDTEIVDDSYNSDNTSYESSKEKIITIPIMNNIDEPRRKRRSRP